MSGNSESLPVPEEVLDKSEIAKFFSGRSIFITGGAGFLGSVLLEIILKCCPEVHRIYLLLREKRGVSAEARRSAIFQKKIFDTLKSQNPEIFSKVCAVEGDIISTNLGIESSVLEELEENVSVVLHCAAMVRFSKPLRYAIKQNALGTENVVNFSRKLKKLAAFIHTSTTFCNCNLSGKIEEKVYKLNVPARRFMDAVKSEAEDEVFLEMQANCPPPWPNNSYPLSKAITENYLNDEASDLPLGILRPSVIFSTLKGSSPGYIEEGSGLIDLALAIGKGFMRVFYADGDMRADSIPVDYVANAILAAAWAIATKKMVTPLVINVASSDYVQSTWRQFIDLMLKLTKTDPFPNMFQTPSVVMCKYAITYWPNAIVHHYIPAIGLDAMLIALGKKPKVTKMYKFLDTFFKYSGYFGFHEWHFKSDNLRKLAKLQNPTDAETFYLDLTDYRMETIVGAAVHGAPFFDWKTDKRSREERINLAFKRYLFINFFKYMVLLAFFSILFFIFKKIIYSEYMF